MRGVGHGRKRRAFRSRHSNNAAAPVPEAGLGVPAAFWRLDGADRTRHEFSPDSPISSGRQHSEEAPPPWRPRQSRAAHLKRRIRKVFGNIHEVVQMPNLIEVQREILRTVPAVGSRDRLCLGPGKDPALGLPDPRFRRHCRARLRELRARGAEVRHRRVPPARHHLCGADARHPAPDRVRGGRRIPRPGRSSISRSRTCTWATCRS